MKEVSQSFDKRTFTIIYYKARYYGVVTVTLLSGEIHSIDVEISCCIGTCIVVLALTGVGKIMEFVMADTHFFINMELGHHLPVIQPVSFWQ